MNFVRRTLKRDQSRKKKGKKITLKEQLRQFGCKYISHLAIREAIRRADD